MTDRRANKTTLTRQRHGRQASGRGSKLSGTAAPFKAERYTTCDRSPGGTAQVADIAATEAAGTSTTFGRGDHVHKCSQYGDVKEADITDLDHATPIATHAGDDNAHHEVFENLVEDPSPQLGANLDCQEFSLDATTNVICAKPLKRTTEGYIFVREGTGANARDIDDFTVDGDWHEMDLADLVPAIARGIVVQIFIKDAAANMTALFREKDWNGYQLYLVTQLADVYISQQGILTFNGTDQKIDYWISTGMDICTIQVVGWFE